MFTDPAHYNLSPKRVNKNYLIDKYFDSGDSGQGNTKNRANSLVKFGVPTPGGDWLKDII